MPYGLPSRGQHDWDDEVNNSVDAVKSIADSAAAAAASAQGAANSAAASATTANNTANTANTNASAAVTTANSAATNAATALAATTDAGIAGTVNAGTQVKAIIQALVDKKASSAVFYARNYGAAQNGTTDDTTAFQNAITAADAVDGIVKWEGILRITGPVTVPPGVSLQSSPSKLTSMTQGVIKLDSATACLKFQGGDARGGYHTGFNINANNTGAPAGAVQITAVQQAFDHITVTNAAGVGVLVFASQNCVFRGFDVNASGTDNWVIDGGSGGLLFTRCESTSPVRDSLVLTDGNPGGHPTYGYQYGPADIEFHKCIFETYTGSTAGMVNAKAGNRIKFNNCGFSGNGATSITNGYIIKVDNPIFTTVSTILEFESCNFHGGATVNSPMFYLGASRATVNQLIVHGFSFFQQSTAVFNTDGSGVLIYEPHGDYVAGTVTNMFGALGGANWLFSSSPRRNGTVWAMPDATGAWAGSTPIKVRKDTDSTAGSRMYVANDGTLGWPNGTNNVAQVSLTPDTTNKFLTATGIKFSGKKLSGFSSVTVSSAGTALTTDCSAIAPKYALILNSSGAVTSWTLSNPTDGQELQLWVTRAGAQTFVWPTNISWNGNTAPSTSPTANQYTIVNLVYVAASSKWYEHADRSVGVPN